jgi:hypothetical protein
METAEKQDSIVEGRHASKYVVEGNDTKNIKTRTFQCFTVFINESRSAF